MKQSTLLVAVRHSRAASCPGSFQCAKGESRVTERCHRSSCVLPPPAVRRATHEEDLWASSCLSIENFGTDWVGSSPRRKPETLKKLCLCPSKSYGWCGRCLLCGILTRVPPAISDLGVKPQALMVGKAIRLGPNIRSPASCPSILSWCCVVYVLIHPLSRRYQGLL